MSSLSFSIRQALPTEHKALCALFEELDEHHRLARPDVFRKPLGARREESFLNLLITGPDSTVLVAEGAERKLLGLAVLIIKSSSASIVRDMRRYAELEELVVRSDTRRLGVAQSLVTSSKAWAKSREVSSLEVSVWSFNIGAIAFYKKTGFHPTVERLAMPLG